MYDVTNMADIKIVDIQFNIEKLKKKQQQQQQQNKFQMIGHIVT